MDLLMKVSDEDDEIAKNFKRLLIKSLAEKEAKNINEMYHQMKFRSVQTQVESEQIEPAKTCRCQEQNKPPVSDNGDVDEETSVAEMASKVELEKVKLDTMDDTAFTTLRFLNFPPDADKKTVESLFGIEVLSENIRKMIMVEVGPKRKGTTEGKIVAPQKIAEEIKRFHLKKWNKRTLKIFEVEACNEGVNCKRKVCRFGHVERYFSGSVKVPDLEDDEEDQVADDTITNNNNNNRSQLKAKHSQTEGNGSSFNERFIRIRNLPKEISELGLLRLFQFDRTIDKNMMEKCHVVSLKKMDGQISKVEGVISVPDCLVKVILGYNGTIVDGIKIQVQLTNICRYGNKCFSKKCDFMHDVERIVHNQVITEKCKYGNKCKKRNCIFIHESQEPQSKTDFSDRTFRKYDDIPAWCLVSEERDGQMGARGVQPTQRKKEDQFISRVSTVIKNWENRKSSGIKVWK